MRPTQPIRKAIQWFVSALAIAAIGILVYVFGNRLASNQALDAEVAMYEVKFRVLEDRVVERGTVESQNTVYGKCEVPGRNKITFIVPEGTQVTKGEVVAKFETNELDNNIQEMEVELNKAKGELAEATQSLEIQRNENETNIASAQLAFDIASIELTKYEKGDYVAEVADLERAIKEAEAELEKVRDEKNTIRLLVKKGFRTPQQLREYELRETTYEFAVERDQQKLKVLMTYDKMKRQTELRGKKAETKLKLDRAKKTADAELKKAEGVVLNAKDGVKLRESQVEELKKLRQTCQLLAEQDGTVAYANEPWYDPAERIREGTEVYSGRAVYYLPDMTKMQVKANVHESVVDRIKAGQKVQIRLDAFADRKLNGTVSSVAGMAASSYSSVQNYETIILIDELPVDLAIKPGMTAEVDILVGTYNDTLAVPIGALTEHFGQSFAYVVDSGGDIQRRRVEVGRSTHSFVEVTKGLSEGESVTLDAYQRGVDDFAAENEAIASTEQPTGPT